MMKKILKMDDQSFNNCDDKPLFQKILREHEQEELLDWIQIVVKDSVKEMKKEELVKSRKRWFFFGRDGQISPEEVKDIEDLIDNSFNMSSNEKIRPVDSYKMHILLILNGGCFKFSNESNV